MVSRSIKKIISLSLFIGIAGGIFYFMLKRIALNWSMIASYPWKIFWLPIICSLSLSIIAFVLGIKSAHILCEVFGGRVLFSRFLYIFCLSQVGRYLPGRFWNIVSLTLLLEREKVKKSASLILQFFYQGILVTVFWVIGNILSGSFVLGRVTPRFSWLAPLSTAFILLILLFLPFFTRWLNYLLNLKFKEVKKINLPKKSYYPALNFLFLSGLALSLSFFLFVYGLTRVPIKEALFIGGIFHLAYVIGWIVFFVPGGLGIREGLLAFFLSSSSLLPPALSSLVALAARLWMTGAEFLLLLGAWIWVVLLRQEKFNFVNLNSEIKGS